jgi:drug/metabolite transporter (DMT)-like permease
MPGGTRKGQEVFPEIFAPASAAQGAPSAPERSPRAHTARPGLGAAQIVKHEPDATVPECRERRRHRRRPNRPQARPRERGLGQGQRASFGAADEQHRRDHRPFGGPERGAPSRATAAGERAGSLVAPRLAAEPSSPGLEQDMVRCPKNADGFCTLSSRGGSPPVVRPGRPRPPPMSAQGSVGAGVTATQRATLIGGSAVLMWAMLALLTTLTGSMPPFQLVGVSFSIAFVAGLVWVKSQGRSARELFPRRLAVWALGVGGLFGFHFFYFIALKAAPPVEANLLNYTWPLLIVLASALLPGERLRWWHLAGALSGLVGAALLITQDGALSLRPEHLTGYGAALCSAVIWAFYSVASRRVGDVPTDAVGGFCGGTALLSLGCHFALERTVWPDGRGWLALLVLGVGPVGLAFFAWDHGVKRGDIRALGALAYAAPLLSTFLLVAFGRGAFTWKLAAACALIVGGAALAARDLFGQPGDDAA